MSWIRETVADSMPVWDRCLAHPFLTELHEGTLPQAKFTNYIVQDSIYLREYARVFGLGILKSRTDREIRMFYGQLGFVTEQESAPRMRWLSGHGVPQEALETLPARPACRAYTRFMLGEAAAGGVPEILMATLPCTLSYFYLFGTLRKRYPGVVDLPYGYVVEPYAGDAYRDACESLGQFAESLCGSLPDARKAALRAIFRTASEHELAFWDMAYEG